jgi:RND superfamily putative drug exporter
MIVVFLSFALAGQLPLKEMGLILAVGVLLDAVFVRLMLQPVVLRVLASGQRRRYRVGLLHREAADHGQA